MLLELQNANFARAVLGGDTPQSRRSHQVATASLDPAAESWIYRHHAFATLGEAFGTPSRSVCTPVDMSFSTYAGTNICASNSRIGDELASTVRTSTILASFPVL